MRPTATHTDDDWQFQRAWWDSDYLPVILLSCLAGVFWSTMALFVSMTWDLDQSWYANSPAYLLPLRILVFWPVWATAQADDALAALGWQISDGWVLLTVVLGILPLAAVSALWIYLTGRRPAHES